MTDLNHSIGVQELPICRLCAQVAADAIDIYSEGASHNLPQIINKHLPITVNEEDTLPLSTCLSCTNTLLAFDQLVTNCVEAGKHFEELEVKDILLDIDCKDFTLHDQNGVLKDTLDETDNYNILTDSEVQNLKAFCQGPNSESVHLKTENEPELTVDIKQEETSIDVSNETANIKKPKPHSSNKECRRKERETINNVKEVVDGKIYYKCKICGKCLQSPYTYRFHMKIHTGERPFVCDLCGKQFRVSQGLARHIRETHAGIKKYPCDICGRMFATRRNAEEHRRIHTNERPYICDLCGKTFKQKASLFVHNRSHTDVFPYRCSYCNQGFRTNSQMMMHITRHTGEKPHACDECGRMFRLKNELTRHKLIHSDEKPFECTHCGVSFRMNRYLRNHLRQNHKQE